MSNSVDSIMYVFEDVKRFHEAFNHPCPSKPTNISDERKEARIKWIEEELQEFIDAKNLTEEVDAMIDCMYFVIGTIVELGMLNELREKLNLKHYDEVREIILKSPEYKTLDNQTKGNLTVLFEDIKYKLQKQNNETYPEEPTRINNKNKYISELELCLGSINDFVNKDGSNNYKYYIFDKMNLMFIKIMKIFIEMGVDPSYPFYLVQTANMSKLWADGKPHYNEDNKVIKPDGWVAPDQKIREYLNYIINRNQYQKNIIKLEILKEAEWNENDDNNDNFYDDFIMEPVSPKTISLCREILDNIDIQPKVIPAIDGVIELYWDSEDLYIKLPLYYHGPFYIEVTKEDNLVDSTNVEEIEEINKFINKYKDYFTA